MYSNPGKWVMRICCHLVCWSYDSQAHGVLLRLLSFIVFPLTGARDNDGVHFLGYLGVHFLFSCISVYTSFSSDGWQWLLLLLLVDVVLIDISDSSGHQRKHQSTVDKTTQVVQSLLATICDGGLLLTDDGIIVGADPKASDLLSLNRQPAPGAPAMGGVLEGVLENGVLCRGLRMLHLALPGRRKKSQVEAYIIPCPLQAKETDLLGMTVDNRFGSSLGMSGRIYLCAIRETDVGDPMQVHLSVPGGGGASAVGMKQNRGNGFTNGASVHHIFQEHHGGRIITSEGSVVESGLGSPRTQVTAMPTKGPSTGPPMPGIPMHALQAVGLGVGSYSKVRVLGKGSQGQVWLVESQDGTNYAQKEIDLKGKLWHRDFPKRLKDADREVRALKGLAWASCVVVPIVDCWIHNDFEMSCIVMEYLPKTLDSVLKKLATDKSGPVPLSVAANWLARLTAGLGAIHSTGFIHRDLKPSNILLDEALQQCKITDLGVSRALHRTKEEALANGVGMLPTNSRYDKPGGSAVGSCVSESLQERQSMVSENMGSMLSGYTVRPGTIAYTSPEANEGSHYGCEADIFSLGVVLLELLTLHAPPEPRLGQVPSATASMDRAQVLLSEAPPGAGAEPTLWQELKRLNIWMLRPDPQRRPTAREIAASKILIPHIEALGEICPRLKKLLL